ncbi:MAG: RNA polymerase sigma factor [Planctomycetota bacterium]
MTIDPETPDRELIEACRDVQDDRFEAAFEELYRRYRDRVYSIAYRITGSATDAMDVVQESFRVLFLKISTFRFDARFSTWLFRIVVNCSIDLRRRERQRAGRLEQSLQSLHDGTEPADQGKDPLASAETSELGEQVQSAIARLSPKLRAILVLRYLEGLSYDEIAETLEVQLGTVKSRLARAHLAIEQVLAGKVSSLGIPIEQGGQEEVA